MRLRSRLLVAAFALFAVGACNSLTGADDLVLMVSTDATDAAAPTNLDGGAVDGPGQDGAPPLVRCDVKRVCMPNDAGWIPVVRMRDANAPCQTEYPSATTLVGVGDEGDCRCACAPVGGTCAGGVSLGFGGSCTASTVVLDLPADGTCASVPPFNLTPPLKITPSSSGPTSCTSKAIGDFLPPAPARFCEGATPSPGSPCESGQQCVPEATRAGENCIAHDGEVACPVRFPSRHVLGLTPVDTRDCSTCECSPDGCAGTHVTFSNAEKCPFGIPTAANGNCSPVVFTSGMIRSAKVQVGGGCKVTAASTPKGSVTFAAPKTVCCG
jgi:hypothetical protein